MTIFREFLPLFCIFQKTNLISFSYLPRPSNCQRMSKIDFLTVATFLEFSLIFTDIHSENLHECLQQAASKGHVGVAFAVALLTSFLYKWNEKQAARRKGS